MASLSTIDRTTISGHRSPVGQHGTVPHCDTEYVDQGQYATLTVDGTVEYK